ncbi:hypothetical protein [Streptomyces sp. NRRL WC-3549]|uniref:hypothetical protein n=1 Tax=Streptomyces sp. NRRL WC-3549 TaxID=1463925 RepID=UPI001F2852AC|nr:hypothetical protein [Streptomyces sp. NRRL WC-3549]
MRFWLLFARAYRGAPSLAAILLLTVLNAVVGAHEVRAGLSEPVTIPYALLIPAVMACVVGLSCYADVSHMDRAGTRRVPLARLLLLLALLAPAAVGLLLLTPGSQSPEALGQGEWAAFRNLLGLTGVVALSVTVFGQEASWVPTTVLTGAALFLGRQGTGAGAWAWIFAPQNDADAFCVAVVLFVCGTSLLVFHGERGLARSVLRY